MMFDLSFIILTWNSKEYLARCLDSFIAQNQKEGISWEIIVVDNGSTDGTCELVKYYCGLHVGRINLLSLKKNFGTTYSRNLGLKKARGKMCCVLDSDTEFHSGYIQDIIELLDDTKIGMVAPRLLLPGGEIQNSAKKFPTFLDKIAKIPGIFLKKKISCTDFYESFPFSQPCPVDTAISACWFFQRSLLEKVGFLDEAIFYSPEDLDYCLRINQSGLRIIYMPKVSILHYTQQISHKKPLSKLSVSHFIGLIYYYRKHGSWLRRPTFSHTQ